MKAVRLRCEQMVDPMGIQVSMPVLSWTCEGGTRQTAYQVVLFDDERVLWDSGKTESDSMETVAGIPAISRQRVTWRVRLWDEYEQVGEWTEAHYEIGLLTKEDWAAKWIVPEELTDPKLRYPAATLRQSFSVMHAAEARLYITCHGCYIARLNGRRIGDFILAPGPDDYARRLQYQTYDVSALLHTGENELQVTLGDGWYRGCNSIDGNRNVFGTDIALLCQLEIGKKPVLISDEKWQASQDGPIRFTDIEQGEIYDARRETITSWHPAQTADFGYDCLTVSDSVAVTEQERFSGKLMRTPNGETVIDFGQNLSGYSEFRLTAHDGDRIVLWHGETLDENGNFTQSNFAPGARNKQGGIPQKIEYICKEGLNIYHPSFSTFGFRYALVQTDIPLDTAEFTAIAVYSDMRQTGFFTCGHDQVNQLFRNSVWSMKSNFVEIPTDCPQRERAGWTGDAGLFAKTAVMLMDCYPVYRKWLAECRLGQQKNGCIPSIVPPVAKDSIFAGMMSGSPGWGDAVILVPWALYRAYGDKSILAENFDMMCGWLRYNRQKAKKTRLKNRFKRNPYQRYVIDTGFAWGEWCEPGSDPVLDVRNNMKNGVPDVATAYFGYDAMLLSKIAAVLGKQELSAQFHALSETVKKAFVSACTENGRIHSRRQCQYVRPLAFGLLTGQDEKQAAADLNTLVISNGYHLNTGFLSTPDLCPVLARYGYVDTAYRVLLQEDCPGWLYAVQKGATTIWENWDGIRSNGTVHGSFNHYAYGAISGWLLSGVAGICLNVGQLEIRPVPDRRIGYAQGEWDSPVGVVKSAWEYTLDTVVFDVDVPSNVAAKFVFPDGAEQVISSGHHRFERKADTLYTCVKADPTNR